MSEQDQGGTPQYAGPERRRNVSELLTREEVEQWRADTGRLTEATELLTGQLGDLTTRTEVDQQLDERVQGVEDDVAAIVAGAKLQSHRVRTAAWIVYAFASVLMMLVLINLHDVQLQECTVKPITTQAQRWACDATLPLHSHISTGDTVVGASPGARVVGGLLYLGLIAGTAVGLRRYQQRRREEQTVLAVSQGELSPQMHQHADGAPNGRPRAR